MATCFSLRILVLVEHGTSGGFDIVGRAHEIILRSLKNEPVFLETEKEATLHCGLESTFNKMASEEALMESLDKVKDTLAQSAHVYEQQIFGDEIAKFEAMETMSETEMLDELGDLNEMEDTHEVVW
jgi:hypothetical protein